MPQDRKYGRIEVEAVHDNFGEEEPVFLLRAQDAAAIEAIARYYSVCTAIGAPPEHVDGVYGAMEDFRAWQERYPTKVPD